MFVNNLKEVLDSPPTLKSRVVMASLMLISLAIIFSYGTGHAAAANSSVIYVNGSGGHDYNNGYTWSTAKLTIKNATGTVSNGGTMNIASGTYTGTGNNNITINTNMTINGANQSNTIINGNRTNTIFFIPYGVNVTIQDLTLTNGTTTGNGGAIFNKGTLTVKNCTFTNNTANGNIMYGGGAIFNWELGTLNVSGSTFTGNSVPNADGGAILNMGPGTLTVNNSKFTNNTASYGGAIFNVNSGTLTVTGSTFTNNNAQNGGGAIANFNDATAAVNFNQIVRNTATNGSAIYNTGRTVNASDNWWGSNNNPSGNVYGNVTVSPWLIKIVSSVNPTNNAVNVVNNKIIIVTFSEPIKAGNKNIVLTSNNGTIIPIKTLINDTVLTITPTNLLINDTKYTLTLHTGSITDMAGNLLSLWSTSFSVGPAPKIISNNPVNGSVNVATNQVIKITLSEPIKYGNKQFEFKTSNGTQVTGFTTSINGKVLTINHTALLAASTKYYVTLHTGSITDIAGNPLALCGFSFTTTKT